MIKVLIKQTNKQISQITITGHSYSDEPGKDLICAGVSTSTTGIINELMRRNVFQDGRGCYELKEGFADIIIDNSDQVVQVVLETFETILKTIENSYPEYLTITIREV